MKRVALVVHDDKPRATDAAMALATACTKRGVETFIVSDDVLPDEVEAIVGVGGDGTVLRAAALAMTAELPVAGINVGRIGYLAEFARSGGAVLVVTHDARAAQYAARTLQLRNGKLDPTD